MNILFVNSTVAWGGVKTWMLEYGSKLAERGHRVIVCANRREKGGFVDACRENGLTAYSMKFGVDFSPWTILWFIRLMRSEGIDIVITNVEKDVRTAGVAARLLGKKVIQRVGLVSDLKDRLKVRVSQRAIVDDIIVPCQYLKDGLLKKLKWLDRDKITVIHNGKDLKKYKPGKFHDEIRGELGIPLETILLGASSQLRDTKGHVYLLDSLALLKKKFPDTCLIIAGRGPLMEKLKDKSERLGLRDSVFFLGHRNDVDRVMDSVDIAVLPSLDEGFPNTVVEYMAMGKPVVATNVGGIPELVLDGETGFLVQPGDAEGLADALERLIKEKDMRERMGISGRKRVEDFFDIEGKVSELEKALSGPAGRIR